MTPIAPPKVAGRVKDFCERVSPGQTPVYLPVTPTPGAKVVDCFPTVQRQIKAAGGDMVIGWQVWLQPGILIEAEFHAVWRAADGELHDITPKPSGIRQILFLPDPRKVYDERQVENIREPLSDAPEVVELIAAFKADFEFKNRGRLATFHGDLRDVLTPGELKELAVVDQRKLKAQVAFAYRFFPAVVPAISKGKLNRNAPCHCGSGRKYKQCHGR